MLTNSMSGLIKHKGGSEGGTWTKKLEEELEGGTGRWIRSKYIT